jgi:hypothetical protein
MGYVYYVEPNLTSDAGLEEKEFIRSFFNQSQLNLS